MINSIKLYNTNSNYCRCEGIKRPPQSHYSLSLQANASRSHNMNEITTSHFTNVPRNDMQTLRNEFPYLQIPCPIVEVDSFKNSSLIREGTPTILPYGNLHYTWVDPKKVEFFVNQGEKSLPYLADIIAHSNNEVQLTETLYILNSMIDNGVKGVDKMYPALSRLNNTTSPNVQTFLAGIYRKTQVPDAFGPLVKMLIQNSLKPQTSNFDPNEEIGGAILSYLNPRFRTLNVTKS